jgi:hypothetical protein
MLRREHVHISEPPISTTILLVVVPHGHPTQTGKWSMFVVSTSCTLYCRHLETFVEHFVVYLLTLEEERSCNS